MATFGAFLRHMPTISKAEAHFHLNHDSQCKSWYVWLCSTEKFLTTAQISGPGLMRAAVPLFPSRPPGVTAFHQFHPGTSCDEELLRCVRTREKISTKQSLATRWTLQKYQWANLPGVARKRRGNLQRGREMTRREVNKTEELRKRRRRWKQQQQQQQPFPQRLVCRKSRTSSDDTSCLWSSSKKKER